MPRMGISGTVVHGSAERLIIEAILKEVYGGAGEEREEPRKGEEAPDNLKRFFSGLPKQEVAERSGKIAIVDRRRLSLLSGSGTP